MSIYNKHITQKQYNMILNGGVWSKNVKLFSEGGYLDLNSGLLVDPNLK